MRPVSTFTLTCLLFLACQIPGLAQAITPLITPSPAEQRVTKELLLEEEGTKRSGTVTFAGLTTLNSLSKQISNQTTTFTISPFPDVKPFTISIAKPNRITEENTIWSGYLQPESDGNFIVVLGKNNSLSISLFSTRGNFSIYTTSESLKNIATQGALRVVEEDETQPLDCANDNEDLSQFEKPTGPAPQPTPGDGGNGRKITVLILYTNRAEADLGGAATVKNRIENAVEAANLAFKNSGIEDLEVEAKIEKTTFTESSSFSADLERITNNSSIQDRRAATKADVVSLLRGKGDSWGIAYVLSSLNQAQRTRAYNVVYAKESGGTWMVFAHELGHNLGCAHNKSNAGNSGLKTDSKGWFFRAIHQNKVQTVGTIMSYIGARIPHYSNPNVRYPKTGEPSGATGQPNSADNAKTINLSRSIVSSFY